MTGSKIVMIFLNLLMRWIKMARFTPQIAKLLNNKSQLISTFSTESKLNILKTAQTGNYQALRQQIDYIGLSGDY